MSVTDLKQLTVEDVEVDLVLRLHQVLLEGAGEAGEHPSRPLMKELVIPVAAALLLLLEPKPVGRGGGREPSEIGWPHR